MKTAALNDVDKHLSILEEARRAVEAIWFKNKIYIYICTTC